MSAELDQLKAMLATATLSEMRAIIIGFASGFHSRRPLDLINHILDTRLEANQQAQSDLCHKLKLTVGQHAKYQRISLQLDGLYRRHTELMNQRFPKLNLKDKS